MAEAAGIRELCNPFFRHSLRDRLRAVECPADIADAIGGWTTVGVGEGYGKGYGLAVKKKWILQLVSPHI